MSGWTVGKPNRRGLLMMAAAAGAALAMPYLVRAAADGKRSDAMFGGDLTSVRAAIEKQRPEAIKRLQSWIALPSIAAENRNMKEGCQMMMDLLKDAGFQRAKMMPSARWACTACTTSSNSCPRNGARLPWMRPSSTRRRSAR